MSNDDAINILSGNWGTAFTADDVPEIRRKAAAEARSALLAEVLAVVDAEKASIDSAYKHHLNHMNADEMFAFAVAGRHMHELRILLAALNQTENDEP